MAESLPEPARYTAPGSPPAAGPAGALAPGLFGHPKGLAFLFTTEMWERFSYYGMRALLVLYMTKYLLVPRHAGQVAGLAGVKSALEAVFGPLDVQPLVVADLRLLHGARLSHADFRRPSRRPRARPAPHRHHRRDADGDRPFHDGGRAAFSVRAARADPRQRRVQAEYFHAGRRLYAPGDRRRDRAYSIFYVGINVGAFLAPLVCGTLGEEGGLALRFCRRRRRHADRACRSIFTRCRCLPADELHKARTPHRGAHGRSTATNGAPSIALLVLFVPTTLFWATYEQSGNTIVLWADANTDRTIELVRLDARKSRRRGFSPSIPS